MVDPNRKINRLTEKDIEFLDECQEEFANRFTEDDPDFFNHCSKPLVDPPIVENWGYSGAGNSHRGGNRGGWNNRGRGRGHGNNRRYNSGQPYMHNSGRYDGQQQQQQHGHSAKSYDRNFQGANKREERPYQPMEIRRDYGNFVPASKD